VINKYVSDNHFTFKIGMGGERVPGGKQHEVFGLYGVQAYPTNYLVDPAGKVVYRSVGFNEAGLRAALEKLGVK
jgi:hypothetical protein